MASCYEHLKESIEGNHSLPWDGKSQKGDTVRRRALVPHLNNAWLLVDPWAMNTQGRIQNIQPRIEERNWDASWKPLEEKSCLQFEATQVGWLLHHHLRGSPLSQNSAHCGFCLAFCCYITIEITDEAVSSQKHLWLSVLWHTSIMTSLTKTWGINNPCKTL